VANPKKSLSEKMIKKIQVIVAVGIVLAVYLAAAVAMWREEADRKNEMCPTCGREGGK
jgi:hypothetical protein